MYTRAKQATALILPVMLIGMVLFSACENDLNKIKEISAKQVSQPIEITTGVEVIYSDSAIVKGKMITPLLIHHSVAKPFYVMPKGVKVIFYDNDQKESSNIVADSAVQHEKEQIIEFHKNVVATNAEGDTYRSEELIWDQVKKILYSNKPVQITTANGNVMNGANLMSDDKLNHPIMGQSTGTFPVTDKLTE